MKIENAVMEVLDGADPDMVAEKVLADAKSKKNPKAPAVKDEKAESKQMAEAPPAKLKKVRIAVVYEGGLAATFVYVEGVTSPLDFLNHKRYLDADEAVKIHLEKLPKRKKAADLVGLDLENVKTVTKTEADAKNGVDTKAEAKAIKEAEKDAKAKAREEKKAAREAEEANKEPRVLKTISNVDAFEEKWGKGQHKLMLSFVNKDYEIAYFGHYARGGKGVYLNMVKATGSIYVEVTAKAGEEVAVLQKVIPFVLRKDGAIVRFTVTKDTDKVALKALKIFTKKLGAPKA